MDLKGSKVFNANRRKRAAIVISHSAVSISTGWSGKR